MPKPEPKHKHLPYRPEVDGLRALAIIPVILFHAGFKLFGGGYVGVDVFFVISGFLITSIILAEMQAGTFTLTHFYERRVRRILPALFMVMAFCLPLAWLLMLPQQMKEFSHSLMAVPVFSSNILFLREDEYFAPSALEKPLLHTWSLAVEEQYYVFFPLFIMVFFRFGRRKLASLIALATLISLVISEYARTHHPAADFYLAPPRAWEILTGALFAMFAIDKPLYERCGKNVAQILSAFGLILIVACVFIYKETTPFPGIYAVPPVLGAALLLGFAGRGTLVGRLLSLRPVVGIGLISYSFYLWHQPVFAFARLYNIGTPSTALYLGLCVISCALAWLTWKLVENPLRNKEKFNRCQVFIGAAVLSCLFIAAGYAGHASKGFRERFTQAQLDVYEPVREAFGIGAAYKNLPGLEALHYKPLGAKGVKPSIILFGDSHARAIATAFGEELNRRNLAGLYVSYADDYCEAIPGFYNSAEPGRVSDKCTQWQKEFQEYIAANKDIKTVIVSMRWTYRLYPVKGAVESLTFDNGEGGVETDSYREYYTRDDSGRLTADGAGKEKLVRDLLLGFASTGKQVIVLYPVPDAGWNISQLAYKNMLHHRQPDTVSTSYERFLSRNKYADDLLDSVSAPNLMKIRPSDALCNVELEDRCVAQVGGTPLYFDDDHLSTIGAERVVKQIMGTLR